MRKLLGYEEVDKKSKINNGLAADRMVFVDINNIESFQKLADNVIYGFPILINLDNFDRDEANKLLSFLTGVIYATNGKQFEIKDSIFLFCNEDALIDRSIEDFVLRMKER